MMNPDPDWNSSLVVSIEPLRVTTPIRWPLFLGAPYPSPRAVPAPTMSASATERSRSSTLESLSLESPADTPSTTVDPSIDVTMHIATQGRSARCPSGAA